MSDSKLKYKYADEIGTSQSTNFTHQIEADNSDNTFYDDYKRSAHKNYKKSLQIENSPSLKLNDDDKNTIKEIKSIPKHSPSNINFDSFKKVSIKNIN